MLRKNRALGPLVEYAANRDFVLNVGGLAIADLIDKLEASGVHFNEYARVLFEMEDFSNRSKARLSLVIKCLGDLGIKSAATYDEIVSTAKGFGLLECPLPTAAYLRLQFKDQEEGTYLQVASQKPKMSEDFPSGFYLRVCNGKIWLRGYRSSSDYRWPINSEFVFRTEDQP